MGAAPLGSHLSLPSPALLLHVWEIPPPQGALGRARKPQQGQDPPAGAPQSRAAPCTERALGAAGTCHLSYLAQHLAQGSCHPCQHPQALPAGSALLPGLHRAARRDRLLSIPCSLHCALPPLPSSSHGEFPSSSVISSIIASANNNHHGLLPSPAQTTLQPSSSRLCNPPGEAGSSITPPHPGNREENNRQGMGVNAGALSQAQTPHTSHPEPPGCRTPWDGGQGWADPELTPHHLPGVFSLLTVWVFLCRDCGTSDQPLEITSD